MTSFIHKFFLKKYNNMIFFSLPNQIRLQIQINEVEDNTIKEKKEKKKNGD